MSRALAVLYAILSCTACAACARCYPKATDPTYGVPNLHEVDPGVWRSGQPAGPEGWAYLRALGVRRVVKLNFESEASEDGARAVGMDVVYVPILPDEDPLHVFFVPDPDHVARAVQALGEGGGVLVKCEHGEDRTGLVVALYRMKKDGWTKERARAEMLRLGFHVELVGLDRAWAEAEP